MRVTRFGERVKSAQRGEFLVCAQEHFCGDSLPDCFERAAA